MRRQRRRNRRQAHAKGRECIPKPFAGCLRRSTSTSPTSTPELAVKTGALIVDTSKVGLSTWRSRLLGRRRTVWIAGCGCGSLLGQSEHRRGRSTHPIAEIFMQTSDIVILSGAHARRWAGFQGELSGLTAPQLGAGAIAAAVARSGLKPEDVSETLMGCVLPAGLGQGARRARRRVSPGCRTVCRARRSTRSAARA